MALRNANTQTLSVIISGLCANTDRYNRVSSKSSSDDDEVLREQEREL